MEAADRSAAEEFAESLPDHPFSFGAGCVIRRGVGKVWIRGAASHPSAAVVVASSLPAEPMAFGSDPQEIWTLLAEIPNWECVNLSREVAPALAGVLERELGSPTRLYDDVYFVLDRPAVPQHHPSVRRLTEDDLAMVERAPVPLQPMGFDSVLAALSGGVVAGGVVDGELVSTISMTVSSRDYADVGGHTLEAWRNRGLASAAAYLVAQEVAARGMTPVWSTGEENVRSQRVAEKLGFREFGRQAYVVVPNLQISRGFRPEDPAGARARSGGAH
jgi:RimJ/RimL family protein N-acetyltransferase